MQVSAEQLEAFLLDSGLVTKQQLAQAKEQAQAKKQNLADVVVGQGLVNKEQMAKLKAYILGIPFVDLTQQKAEKQVLILIPEIIARKHSIVAYRREGDNLEVAMLDPEDLQMIDFIKKKTNLKILPRLASEQGIKAILDQYQKSLKAEFSDLIEQESAKGVELKVLKEAGLHSSAEDLEKAAQEMPIIKIVDTLLKHAILQDASDIHIEPMEQEIAVRYRIDGILRNAMVLPKQVQSGMVARIKVLANLKLDEHRLPQDGRFKIEETGHKVSFRVSIMPVYDGEKVVMRLLPEDSKGFSLEKLGFAGQALEILHKNIKKPNGMILATGPTGSGKTTTLYTILDILNTPGVNICTIEDPIEYRIGRINQTQVKPSIGLTFANGLRSLVRQDPDIIMVGEIRDNETASLAVNAALTGHLVFSTLHTNSAAGALPRLIDMKIEPFLLASTCNVIIAQRLVRRLHESTKKKYQLSKQDIQALKKDYDLDRILKLMHQEKVIEPGTDWPDLDFYQPAKSKECADGYKSRLGIHEVLNVTATIKELIVDRATIDQLEGQAKKEGMITMLEDGFIKAAQGLTSLEEVMRVTKE